MNEIQINESINKLKDINIGRIDNDSTGKNSKLNEVNSILDAIIKSGNASKDELKEIINILKTESSVSGLDMIVYHNLVHRMHDFEKLLSNYNEEEKIIRNETQYNANKNKESVESKVYTSLFTMESRIASAKNTIDLDVLRKELININKSEKRLGVINEIDLLQEKITKKYAELNNSKRKFETGKVKTTEKGKGKTNIGQLFNEINTSTLPKDGNGSNLPVTSESENNKQNPVIPENQEKKSNFVTKMYFKDGKSYIIGNKGEEIEVDYKELNSEFKNKSMLLNDFSLILNIIGNEEKLKTIHNELGNLIEKGDFIEIEKYIISIIEDIYKNSNGAIYPQNIEKNKQIQKIFKLDSEKRHLELLKFLDNNGNSQLVKQDIIERNFEKTKITNDDIEQIRKLILENNEKESLNLILNSDGKNNNYLSKFKYLFKNEDSVKDFIKSVQNADKKGQKIIEQEKNKQGKRVLDKKYEEAIKLDISDAIIKNECMNALIMGDASYSKANGYKGENKELELLGGIEGLGYFKLSRDSEELAEIIAIEALAMIAGTFTAGVGEAAIHALAGARYLKRVRTLINAENKFAKGSKFALESITSGTSFYGGYAGTQSLIEGKSMYSWKGAAESIVFMGAFKGLNAVYSKVPGIKLDTNKPLTEQKIKLGTQMLIDGTVFSGIGLTSEGIILKPDEWTAEEIIQAFAMAIFFRGISQVKGGTEKLFVRKGENGKIETGIEELPEVKKHNKNLVDGKMVPDELLGEKKVVENIKEKFVETKEEDPKTHTESEIKNPITINGEFLKESISKKLSDKIGKLKKGKEVIDFGEFKISKNENNEFILENNTGVSNFKRKEDLIDFINESILNNANSRFNFLNKNLDINFKKSINNEINIGDETFRINEKGEIETKGKYNEWKKLERDLTDDEMDIIGKRLFGYEFKWHDLKNILKKIEIKNLISKSEEEWILTKYGKKGLDKIKNELKELKNAATSGTRDTLTFLTGIGKSTNTFRGAILWTTVGQLGQVRLAGPSAYIDNFHGKDGIEIVSEIIAIRYMGFLRAAIATGVYAGFDDGIFKEIFKKDITTNNETKKLK